MALRTHQFDGKPIQYEGQNIVSSNLTIIVASLDDESIDQSSHLGIVPFGEGRCKIKTKYQRARFIEHHLHGKQNESQLTFTDELALKLNQNGTLEWVEIIFEKE